MIDTEKNKTAWHNQKMPESMMDTHFPHLINSDHFKAIKQCFSHIGEAKSLIDLGCGKAEISDAFPEYKYCGADLPHIDVAGVRDRIHGIDAALLLRRNALDRNLKSRSGLDLSGGG